MSKPTDYPALRRATVDTVLRGPGETSPELRQKIARGEAPTEMHALVEKIRHAPYSITDEDVAALTQRGRSEDELFEIIIAAAVGAAGERLDAALRALEDVD
jgi:hypothetical protein